MEQIYDMIVIGGGPAGYTAALYAARAGLSTLVLEKLSAGGQMALTEQIDNYPGFEDGIDGFTLGEKMQQSAERFGAVTELAEVYKASLSGEIKTLETSEGVFQGRTVVIATGASPRPLGVPGEDTLIGKGVHYCAACDGAPIGARPWRWWAAATPPRRTLSPCPVLQRRSISSTAATACGRRRSIMSR